MCRSVACASMLIPRADKAVEGRQKKPVLLM
jgi:hypothetical protein